MKIAIDVSPLQSERLLAHRVRGTGFYIENLKEALLKYYSQNEYIFFTTKQKLSSYLDLIHYPYFEPFFLTLPFIKKYKTIVTVHDLIPLVFPKHFPAGIRGSIKWRIQKWSLHQVNAIITDSECSKKDIIQYTNISNKKVHVVYLAAGEDFKKLETGNWKLEIKSRYNLPDRFALYVGDVTWNKNLPRLIEAIKKINLTLVMVGKALVSENFDKANPWNQDLARVKELIKGDKRFIQLGFIPKDDLVGIYNLATVFVMPSLYEGFGLPILEAMACGCPVVTSKEGSIPEVAGDAAFYVDPYDVKSIASGIKGLFENEEERKCLSSEGIDRAKKFSWKKIAEETMVIYERGLK